ncbi:MAG TPA: BtpA/SgcQ family protein [Candidatus Krumholzibacteria bacterium]|nr:BtpA/SgcQ family protein [Candidatus Krumholzibacteria bacterium]HRX51708.1 BtpA/SgcQ family protein [Candidatus Krumholzibacteria bacterium]
MWTRKHFRTLAAPPVIGMIHLRPLPDSPGWAGDLNAVEQAALADAEALARGGAGALMLENYGDVPFHRDAVPAVTVAAMTRLAHAVRRAHPDLPLGINVLRNDVASALAVAAAVDAAFVRVNVLTGAMVTDQGLIQGKAAEVLRLRARLCPQVGILADIRVKHAAPLAERPLADEAADLRLRAGADALIVSGAATGSPADPARLDALRAALPDCPLLVGSGADTANVAAFAAADGVIVGSSLKSPGADGRPVVDPDKVRAFVAAARFPQPEDPSA